MSVRDYLIYVYKDTQTKCLTGFYGKLKPEKSYLFTTNDPRFKYINKYKKYNETSIKVINEDVLIVTEKIFRNDFNKKILVLNLANDRTPGGGVERGAMAQEEELFRRTNYFMNLQKSLYPFDLTNVILTERVTVVKNEKYEDLNYPFTVSMLASAAITRPHLTPDENYTKEDRKIMQYTIDNIFRVAKLFEYDILILGALGCGAFQNPPEIVANIFKETIKTYDKCFDKIIFAVKSKNDNNYDTFNKVLGENK